MSPCKKNIVNVFDDHNDGVEFEHGTKADNIAKPRDTLAISCPRSPRRTSEMEVHQLGNEAADGGAVRAALTERGQELGWEPSTDNRDTASPRAGQRTTTSMTSLSITLPTDPQSLRFWSLYY